MNTRSRRSLLPVESNVVYNRTPSKRKQSIKPAIKNTPSNKLQPALDNELVGREKEYSDLVKYFEDLLVNNASSSLYISGSPGTGKTLTVTNAIKCMGKKFAFTPCFINCFSVSSSNKIYTKILDNLGIRCQSNSEKVVLASLYDYLEVPKCKLVLVLDEIDHLNSRNQNILYEIYSWPSKFASQVLLIGIANSLDLTERLLPNLVVFEKAPVHISFSPYSPEDLTKIVLKRLSESSISQSVEEAAVKLCAKKISSSSGDVRRALAVCQKAIQLAESEELNNGSLKSLSLKHVLRALREYECNIGGKDKENSRKNMPLQHKVLLSSLLLIKKDYNMRNIPMGLLHDIYKDICGNQGLPNLDMSDLTTVCESLSSYGFVQILNPGAKSNGLSTPSRKKSIQLLLDDKGIQSELNNNELFSSIMSMKIKS